MGVVQHGDQLLAVAATPSRRVPPQDALGVAGVHCAHPGLGTCNAIPSRRAPSAAIAPRLRTAVVSSARPAAVNLYGRRRSSWPAGSIRPCSSSAVIAPYSVPGPSVTPANCSISRASAYPCLAPEARLVMISTPGSFRLPSFRAGREPRAMPTSLVRTTYYAKRNIPIDCDRFRLTPTARSTTRTANMGIATRMNGAAPPDIALADLALG